MVLFDKVQNERSREAQTQRIVEISYTVTRQNPHSSHTWASGGLLTGPKSAGSMWLQPKHTTRVIKKHHQWQVEEERRPAADGLVPTEPSLSRYRVVLGHLNRSGFRWVERKHKELKFPQEGFQELWKHFWGAASRSSTVQNEHGVKLKYLYKLQTCLAVKRLLSRKTVP